MDITKLNDMTETELYDVIKQAERDQRGSLDLAQQEGAALGGVRWGTFWGAHSAYQQLTQILYLRLLHKQIPITAWLAEMEEYEQDIVAGKMTREDRDMAMIL